VRGAKLHGFSHLRSPHREHGRLKGWPFRCRQHSRAFQSRINGRSSSIRPSGWIVRRPNGQWKGSGGSEFGPVASLDFELELGAFVGPGNKLGEPIPIQEASRHIRLLPSERLVGEGRAMVGASSRSVSRKNFATTISPGLSPRSSRAFRSRAHVRDQAILESCRT